MSGTIEEIQRAHVRTVQGHNRDEVCAQDGRAWPCDVAMVFEAWDKDGARQIAATRAIYRDVASRLVRDLTEGHVWKRKAEHPDSSYDPLIRESAVLAILAALATEDKP